MQNGGYGLAAAHVKKTGGGGVRGGVLPESNFNVTQLFDMPA